MGTRAVFLDGIVFPLGVFLCFFYLGVFGFNILLSGLGVVFGLVFGVAVALRYIRILERKGEIRVTLKSLAFMLLTIGIVLGIALYLLFSLGLEAGIQIGSFIYPFFPALFGARIVLYMNWERKHKKHILFEGLVFTRVYAVPKD
ncbi:hypothetical protein E3I90_02620 [Candidatus Bathyarchaeota archaeon]|nr:MAG: hypothetical protein E3I90_02620 [Candidatus Bathyarchaeota archaeon]